MTDTPLTRAARALVLSQSGCESYDDLEPEAQEQARETVRAVIGAIREPSDSQLIEAQRMMLGETRSAPPSSAIAIGYRAMNDTALSE